MSYPPPAYEGTTGELSATYRPNDTTPDFTYANGNTVEYLATGAGTRGLFGLYRWNMAPRSAGPDAHFHRSITESFYVLTGSVSIFDGTTWLATGPGDWVHVPEGGVHGFRNATDEPSSMLLHFSPGAPREAYFENLPRVPEMTPDELAAFYLEHDNFWL